MKLLSGRVINSARTVDLQYLLASVSHVRFQSVSSYITKNVAIALHCNLKSARRKTSYSVLWLRHIMLGSVQIVCSSSGLTVASSSVELPSKTWHIRRSGLWPRGWNAAVFFCSPHLSLLMSLCPCAPAWIGFGIFCAQYSSVPVHVKHVKCR